MESSHDAAAPSSPIQVFLELDDPDDMDDLLLDQLDPLSNLGHDEDHTRSFTEYSLANDLPMPDDPVPDPKTLDKTNPAAQTLECKKEEEPEPDSPFGTPEPQPVRDISCAPYESANQALARLLHGMSMIPARWAGSSRVPTAPCLSLPLPNTWVATS